MIQILGGTEGLEELEGIKISKFIKRATGSKRMNTALLKTAAGAAIIGGTAYYTNRKYNWWGRLKNKINTQLQKGGTAKKNTPQVKSPTSKPSPKKDSFKFSTDLIKDAIYAFLTPKTKVQPVVLQQDVSAPTGPFQNPVIPAIILISLIGGYLLLKKR